MLRLHNLTPSQELLAATAQGDAALVRELCIEVVRRRRRRDDDDDDGGWKRRREEGRGGWRRRRRRCEMGRQGRNGHVADPAYIDEFGFRQGEGEGKSLLRPRSCLQLAGKKGFYDVSVELLNAGADINLQGEGENRRETAIHLTTRHT